MPPRKKKKDKQTDVVNTEGKPVFDVLDIDAGFSSPAPSFAEATEGKPDLSNPPIVDFGISDRPPNDDSGFIKKPRKPRTKKIDENGEPLIDGEMLLTLIDLIIPMLISTSHNLFGNGNKLSPDDLMLTEKQKLSMQRFADKVAERIDINANPYAVLFFGLSGIYTVNYLREKEKK